jgi:alpha-tubulin suppressor-like RCC1 family protein
LKSLFIKLARLALVLTVGALLLTACGAGVSEVANPPVRGNVTVTGTVTAVVSPSRVVTGQIYTYQATAPNGTTVTWNWGDGTPVSLGNTVQKVWNKSGGQTVTLSAISATSTASVTRSVAVSGEPVSAGANHSCALQPSGTVLCWGNNSNGQLGPNATVGASVTATVAVTGLTDAIALSAGAAHTCALKAGGSVVCWGDNSLNQLGVGFTSTNTPVPAAVLGLTDAVAISAGLYHTCAIKANASVACWGNNTSSQLGNGTTTATVTAVAVTGLTNALSVSANAFYTCAVKASGSVICWGSSASASVKLSNGASLTDAVAVSTGYDHACVLRANGSAACWGQNSSGEVGDGTTVTRTISTAVTGLTDAVAISAGGNANANTAGAFYRGRTCAIKANGSTVCWGDKGYAGSGNGVVQATPTAVAGLTDTAALSLGGDHTCALKTNGAIACWGNNAFAQIGDGNIGGIQTNLVAVTAQGSSTELLTDTVAVSAGENHSCALKTGGSVVCWGDNQYGQLGDGTTTTRTVSAVVSSLTDAVTLTTGGNHTCAVKKDGSVVCWGRNIEGELGNGSITTTQVTPTLVIGLTDTLVQLSAGYYHTCAVGKAGGMVCWGRNSEGQLGNTSITQTQTTPASVIGLTDTVTQLSAGRYHTCAVGKTGGVVCWGWNASGQLGNGSLTQTATPTPVIGLTDTVAQLSTGGNHTCAVGKTDGGVVCWGNNGAGQLGNGTTLTQAVPTVAVGSTGTILQLRAGQSHTCVVKTDGSVVCWGDNSSGQLGNGTTTTYLTPTAVIGLPDTVVQLSAGWNHTCSIGKTDGGVVCWGLNSNGQLGGSATINTSVKPRPTAVLGGSIFWQ